MRIKRPGIMKPSSSVPKGCGGVCAHGGSPARRAGPSAWPSNVGLTIVGDEAVHLGQAVSEMSALTLKALPCLFSPCEGHQPAP